MAIAARTRPQMIVTGFVERSSEKTKRASGELFGHALLINTATGGVWVSTWLRDLEDPEPLVGTNVAFVVETESSDQYGEQLTFVRRVSDVDLKALQAAAAGVPA